MGAAVVLALGDSALATPAGPSMPWDQRLTVLRNNLQGTVACILATVAVVSSLV